MIFGGVSANENKFSLHSTCTKIQDSSIHQHPSPNTHHPDTKWHIDLPLCNLLQLEEAGVCQIELSGICTWQQSDDYFSARKLGVNSGRILTGVVLR